MRHIYPAVVLALFIGLYVILLRRPSVGNAVRGHAARDNWAAFNAGYRAALKDTETMRPLTETTTRYSVDRAFRRTYIEREE